MLPAILCGPKKIGVAPQTAPIPFDFGHNMSKLVITLVAGDGFTLDEFATASKVVRLYGINLKTRINVAIGEISVTNDFSAIETITSYRTETLIKPSLHPNPSKLMT